MSTPQSNNTQSSSSNGLSSGATAVTITMVVVGGVVLLVVAVLVIRFFQKKQSATSLKQTTSAIATQPLVIEGIKIEATSMEKFLDDILNEKPIRFSPAHLIDFTNNYIEKLGAGGFGVVYKGELPNGVPVAVKVLHNTQDKRAEAQFMAEVGTIGRTYHINLVRLYGFCFDASVKALVYEYMHNGSLDRYLFHSNHRLEWEKLQDIAIGTARGIRYLHEECQKKIIHYDIKPGNVLLDDDFSPKVADFGLAKLCDRENTHITLTGGRGTPGYAAPELWMPFPVTHKCDVYSFGMLLFEILGRRRNLDVQQTSSEEWFPRCVWEKFEQGDLECMIMNCGIKEKDRDNAERICKVALWCIQYQPASRPSMNSIVRMLEGELEIATPPNPFQYMLQHDPDSAFSSELTTNSTIKILP